MRNNQRYYIFVSILMVVLLINIYHFGIFPMRLLINFNQNENGVNIVDYSQLLASQKEYDLINCRKSAEFYVTTTLCVHDLTRDAHVSRAIWVDGVWEGPILRRFMDYLNQNPDWLVFDIGAQVGQFSLFAAKLGRDVIAVEPFYDNILRIQKAVRIEELEKRITLVRNGLSNKKEVKRLFPYANDLGGQTLLKHKNEVYTKQDMVNDKYLIETIMFDDLIDILPKRRDGKNYEKAILKIDIEGFEPYAFDQAKKIVNKIDFQVVFMEWVHLPRHPDMAPLVEQMIQLLNNKNLVAYDNNNLLDNNNWRQWPQDVIWIKKQQ